MSNRLFGMVGVLALCAGCGSSESTSDTEPAQDSAVVDTAPAEDTLVATMQKYLTGNFDSAEQATSDPSYFDIHLSICEVAVPELGPRVLYVEQARADSLNAPYRQRLYVVERRGDKGVSRVFELKAPTKAKGWCKDPTRLTLGAADVEERAGCAVELSWDGTTFTGGTNGKDCPSTLEGATYATSEVTLDAKGLKSWDRGYDATGKQVWGAVKGPYVFTRRTPL